MFFKEVNEIDLGETTIANIFIDIFMPMANGLYVKVYLLGFRQACDHNSNPKFNNNSIAKNLNVPLSDVIEAWRFWENKKIIKMHKNNDLNDFDYSIEFLDLKKFYVENMYINTTSIKSNSDRILSVSENPNIRIMFKSIDKIIGRQLVPNEKTELLDIMDKYNMSSDMMVYVYEYVKDKHGFSKPIKYMESILRGWYDSNFDTPDDVKNSFAVKGERYQLYRTIFNELGFYNRQPSKSEEKVMDVWLDKYGMDIEVILSACSNSKNVSSPSITYINSIVERWYKNNVKTLDDVGALDSEYKKKKNATNNTPTPNNNSKQFKTRYHNINQRTDEYTTEELEKLILDKQKYKLK